MQHPKDWSKDWIKAGGLLGLAILTARVTRTLLATILSATPFLLQQLRKAENMQNNQVRNPTEGMTREEARLILGVDASASEGQVTEAHRRLIQKNHPDLGGTDYLASKINQARDILLRS
jgi:hypothetical protein